MPTTIQSEIDALHRMTTSELAERYAEMHGHASRTRHRKYLIRKIAWRIQANAEGDLSERARRRAAELADDAEVRLMAPKTLICPPQSESAGTITRPLPNGEHNDPRLPSPGSAIVREYKGRTIRVVVLSDGAGFEWNGDRYRTLSAIAKKVTGSLPGILSNVANKFLRAGFEAVESTWREIAAIRSVRDFKQVSSYSLTGGFVYEEIPPGGELKHATVGETAYTNQAKTYGRMFGIDRRDLINDDLDALTAVPRRLGRGGALKLNEVFWIEFLNNAAFFTAGNKNYAEGVDTALGIDSLTQAEQLFLDQTDPDGHPLAVAPVILLVPNGLYVPATQIMNSTELRDPASTKKTPVANPHAGKFRPVRSSYLSNAQYTGNSTKAWYVLADPNDMPVIEVAFLNGQQMPTVESADADFNTLGIQMRGYHDFGVAKQEPRGGVKLKGEA